MSRSKTSAVRMSAAEFEAKASELRLAGLTIRQIASRLGRSVGGTAKALDRALERAQKEAGDSMEAWRAVEVARLDRLLVAVWPMAIKGNLGAVDRALRIAERRARLLGLDAAQAHKLDLDAPQGEVTVHVVIPDPRVIDRDR